MQVTALNCPKCGASLDVPEGVETLSCKFCGSRSVVHDTSSIRALQLMREDLPGVRNDVDSLVRSRQSLLDQWENTDFALFVEHEKQEDHARKHALIGLPLVIVGVLALIAGVYFWATGQPSGLYLLVGTALFVMGVVKWSFSNRCRRQAETLADQIREHRQRKPA